MKMMKGLFLILLCGLIQMGSYSYAGDREVDAATEAAAKKTITSMKKGSFSNKRIAFLGIAGAQKKLMHVFRAALVENKGEFDFFVRDSKEWDVIMSEVEFADRKSDLMDPASVAKFGDLQQCNALLYGRILETSTEGKTAVVRLSMTLTSLKGRFLWSKNVTAKYPDEATLRQGASMSVSYSQEVDNAIESAAFKAIRELNRRQFPSGRIAFLGFIGGNDRLHRVFQGGLGRIPGPYQFFIRDTFELDTLVSEKEFQERKRDLLDTGTINFESFKGCNGILYGRVLEVGKQGDKAVARFSLTLANPKTLNNIWSANITAEYLEKKVEEVSPELIEVAVKAGKEISKQLTDEMANLPTANVFVLPVAGIKSSALGSLIAGEIRPQGGKWNTFTSPAGGSIEQRFVNDLAMELTGDEGSSLDMKQLCLIMKQLEQVYDIEEKGGQTSGSTAGNERINAYMTGTIRTASEEAISVSLVVRNLKNNQVIWSRTVVAKRDQDSDEQLTSLFGKNKILFYIGAGILAFFMLLIFMRMMSRAR